MIIFTCVPNGISIFKIFFFINALVYQSFLGTRSFVFSKLKWGFNFLTGKLARETMFPDVSKGPCGRWTFERTGPMKRRLVKIVTERFLRGGDDVWIFIRQRPVKTIRWRARLERTGLNPVQSYKPLLGLRSNLNCSVIKPGETSTIYIPFLCVK